MTSSLRRPLVAGNWKMNTDVDQALALAQGVATGLPEKPGADVVLLPPAISLWALHQVLEGDARILLGAQNCFWEPNGAFTGEISAPMLRALCSFVLVGHSERRQLFGETDAQVRRKLEAVLEAGLRPLVAVGETLEQREAGLAAEVVSRQTRAALEGLDGPQVAGCTIAYEPIWAIGTGRRATPEDAAAAAQEIRRVVEEVAPGQGQLVRVLYGGSVSASSAAELFAPEDVDGGLIGGASLRAGEFCQVVAAAGGGPSA